MRYAYLIQSIPLPAQRYIGLTSNVAGRFKTHNEGGSPNTSKHKPWKLIMRVAFTDHAKVTECERYLNTGSGRACAKKRL